MSAAFKFNIKSISILYHTTSRVRHVSSVQATEYGDPKSSIDNQWNNHETVKSLNKCWLWNVISSSRLFRSAYCPPSKVCCFIVKLHLILGLHMRRQELWLASCWAVTPHETPANTKYVMLSKSCKALLTLVAVWHGRLYCACKHCSMND